MTTDAWTWLVQSFLTKCIFLPQLDGSNGFFISKWEVTIADCVVIWEETLV